MSSRSDFFGSHLSTHKCHELRHETRKLYVKGQRAGGQPHNMSARYQVCNTSSHNYSQYTKINE